MSKLIPNCPACGEKLSITALRCSGCGMELRNDFELSPFDALNPEQAVFLTAFLKHRGNMSSLQSELGLSYPSAKRRLDDLLAALNLAEENRQNPHEPAAAEAVDMSAWYIPEGSKRASDIIKRRLMENNGRAVVHTARGLPCEIRAAPDGVSFFSNKLPGNQSWRYEVFDVIVDLLVSRGGRARKGNGRSCKLGEPDCDETTVAGILGYRYFHAKSGESILDPVFVLAAVLEWAGIAGNERGELVLTDRYREICNSMSGGK